MTMQKARPVMNAACVRTFGERITVNGREVRGVVRIGPYESGDFDTRVRTTQTEISLLPSDAEGLKERDPVEVRGKTMRIKDVGEQSGGLVPIELTT